MELVPFRQVPLARLLREPFQPVDSILAPETTGVERSDLVRPPRRPEMRPARVATEAIREPWQILNAADWQNQRPASQALAKQEAQGLQVGVAQLDSVSTRARDSHLLAAPRRWPVDRLPGEREQTAAA